MKVLVLGANGATGFNVVSLLLKKGTKVKAVTRNVEKFSSMQQGEQIEVLQAGILDMDPQLLKDYLSDVDAVISCLGHNLTLKGIFGQPRTLVADALERVVNTVQEINPSKTIKLILMNTTACLNKLQDELFENKEKVVMDFMRFLLPPQRDNDLALAFLMDEVGQSHKQIEWVAVRPATLIDEAEAPEYSVHPSPNRSPIFDPGKTSRINVADFMANLVNDEQLWEKWKYKTPVIYNMEPGT